MFAIDFLIKNGSPKVVNNVRNESFKLRQLEDFSYTEGYQEKGSGVREKAKGISFLISNSEALEKERNFAKECNAKFRGGPSHSSSGTGKYQGYGSEDVRRGGGGGYDQYQGGSSYDNPYGGRKQSKKESSSEEESSEEEKPKKKKKKSKKQKKESSSEEEESEEEKPKKKKKDKKGEKKGGVGLAAPPSSIGGSSTPAPAVAQQKQGLDELLSFG